MIENVIQIKSVTTINIGAKKHDVKKVLFGILLHVLVKMVNI